METQDRTPQQPTLCWDCAKSLGRCSWSTRFKPVAGWVAKPTTKQGGYSSYLVTECPEFERDAVRGGLYHYKEQANGK